MTIHIDLAAVLAGVSLGAAIAVGARWAYRRYIRSVTIELRDRAR